MTRRSHRIPAKAIQEKLDRLDEAFLFERSTDIETYDGHAEKLREELTLVRIDRRCCGGWRPHLPAAMPFRVGPRELADGSRYADDDRANTIRVQHEGRRAVNDLPSGCRTCAAASQQHHGVVDFGGRNRLAPGLVDASLSCIDAIGSERSRRCANATPDPLFK